MKSTTKRCPKVVWISTMSGLALVILFLAPKMASAQSWTNNGNNIYYNAGTVGIGTNNPGASLDVQGNSTGDTLLRVWNTSSSGTGTTTLRLANSGAQARGARLQFTDSLYYVGMVTGDRTNGLSFRTGTNASAESNLLDRMTILPGGNVGIGTASPSDLLHLSSSANTNIRLTHSDATSNSNALYFNEGATVWGFINQRGSTFTSFGELGGQFNLGNLNASGATALFAGGATRLQLTSGGNVGIGIMNPGYKLDVQGGSINASGGLCIAGDCKTAWSQVGGGGAVASVFGRTGAVVAATNDYTWAQIDKTTSSLLNLTTRSAGDLSSGTLPDARFPTTLPSASGANLTALNASSLGSGTVATARLGSGTANTTTFLRGDNTWAVPSGGSQWTTSGSNINYATSGNVGIGTSSPTSKLHVTGDGRFTGNLTVDGNIAAKYQDMAEWVLSSENIPTGTVVVLDVTKSNQVVRSSQAYDTRVAGVISEQPGIALGESGKGKVLVATTGRVQVKVDATNDPIHIGDLLVTSDIPGVAMKSEPITIGNRKFHTPGTLIGKALEPLEKGSGKILVLLSLQ